MRNLFAKIFFGLSAFLLFFALSVFLNKDAVFAACDGVTYDGCANSTYYCTGQAGVAGYRCDDFNGTFCPETYIGSANSFCGGGCTWSDPNVPRGCGAWAPEGCTDGNSATPCDCNPQFGASGDCCNTCSACTPTSCDATCPTGCGYGAGPVGGTDNCGGSCSISCPATGSCGEGEPTPTSPPPPPGIRNTLGWLDSAACTGNGVQGWGGDPDDINWNAGIHLYFDSLPSDANPAGVNIGAASLNGEKAICDRLTNNAAICSICATDSSQSQCRHRFSYQIPATINRWYGGSINLRDGNTHTVRAFVMNKSGTQGEHLEVENGGVTFSCCTGSCGSAGNYCVGSGYIDGSCGNWCSGTLGPVCANPATVCSGVGITSSNGCGTCASGTLGPVCANPATVCLGTPITSSNGCGTCASGTSGPSCVNPATVCLGTPITSSNGCGTCASGTRCDAPDAPTPVSPNPGQTFSNVTYIDFSWDAPASWTGAGTCGSAGTYNLCIGSTSGSCDYVNTNLGTATSYRYYQSAAGTYYWRVQAVNACDATSAYSTVQTVVLITPAKQCDIDLSAGEVPITGTVTVTMAANAYSTAGDTARLWIEKQNGSIISPNNISPAATQTSDPPYYYYNFAGSSCFTTTSICTTVTNVQVPTVGYYTLHCDLYTDPGKCTGNPFCSINGGSLACAGWASCGNADYTTTPLCSEGFDPANPAYLSAWGSWGACNASHARTRTRTCVEDCTGIASCSTYFAANCPMGSTCVTTGGGLSWTQTETQACYGQMTGTFFDASDLSVCPVDPQTLPANLKISGGTISLTGPTSYGPYTTDAAGLYTTATTLLSPDIYTLSVNPGDSFVAAPKFNCQGTSLTLSGSASGCLTQPCEVPPTTTHDFGFWKDYGGWWQVTGGSIYGGSGIASIIPGTMPAAQQKLILQDANSQDGLAYNKSGTIDLGTYPGAVVSTSGWNAQSGYGGDNQDYDYFTVKMATYTKIAWNGTGQPTYVGANGYDIYTYTGDVTMNWSPGAGQKVIYLIKGNVTISGNITVSTASPTFMAIIASGTITFNTGVTRADGWYVANALNFPTGGSASDAQFDGRGSFIGYNSVTLARDQGVLNNSQPAEKFSFRPDFVINAPAPILEARYVWRQE